MPSIAASMEFESPEKIKKSSTKMMEVDSNSVEKKVKKEKKSSKKSKDKETAASAELEVVKKEKKRKVFDDEDEEEEEVEVNLKKKVKLDAEAEEEEEVEEEEDPNAVKNFRISSPLKAALKAKGIEALFPIQAMTFNNVFDGHDLVGRARTGQGKTLAFVLPILESLVNGPSSANRRSGYGRPPCVLVLLPTRELAQQVAADFEYYGNSLGLKACCLYGNSPMQQQTATLKRGIDIVIGTPGRVKDHVERGNLDFSVLKFRVLDEADEMLRMGFVEDVEFILGKVQDVTKVQTLLFSATLPDWVKKIQERFLKKDKKTVDLVGQSKMKASTNVRHLVMPCSSSARPQLIPDIIRCYSSGGRTIIFTETKESASTLAGVLHEARALHGDIQQSTREVTLKGFKSGRFQTLVATNVAARGLDIDDVQLIIQCEPPRDVEAYIHRSGRTGRAGKSGVAVMLYDPKKSNFFRIEKESGVKFERVSAPQPSDIAKAAGLEAVEKITEASDDVIPVFKEAAEELLNSSGLSAVEILSKALATAAGYTEIKTRSLLSSMENHVTVLLECGRPIYSQSFAYGVLRRFIPEEKVESIKGFALTADGNGAVFDVATSDLDSFLIGQENAAGVSLEVVKSLPALQAKEPRAKWGFGGGGGGRGFSNGRGGGGRGGGGGYNNNRFSSFGGRGRGGNNRKW